MLQYTHRQVLKLNHSHCVEAIKSSSRFLILQLVDGKLVKNYPGVPALRRTFATFATVATYTMAAKHRLGELVAIAFEPNIFWYLVPHGIVIERGIVLRVPAAIPILCALVAPKVVLGDNASCRVACVEVTERVAGADMIKSRA